MKIKSYNDFILESIIYSSPEFVSILKLMKGNEVADKLLDLLDRDIKTNYNFIKMTEEPGKLAFVPDNQATRKLQQGVSKEELFAAASNPTTIGRLVKSIFNSNSMQVNDGTLEIFSNKFRALAELKLNPNIGISIVKGEEIRKWYNEETYAGRSTRQGSLNKSCMRYEECYDYLKIYADNPDVVSMLIKTNMSGELEARALLWQTDMGLYLDRIYFTKDSYNNLMSDWAKVNFGEIFTYDSLRNTHLKVKLKPHRMYNEFPYMDSLCYYFRNTPDEKSAAEITNYVPSDLPSDGFSRLWYCQETDGSAERQDMVYSEYYGEQIPRGAAVWSNYYDSYLPEGRVSFSEYYNDHLPTEVSVWSEKVSSYLDKTRSTQVIINKEGDKDWYPSEFKDVLSKKVFREEISGDLYDNKLKDLFYEMDGNYYDLNKSRFVKVVKEGEQEKLKIYNSDVRYCTELDEKIFGVKTYADPEILSNASYFSLYINCIKSKFIKLVEEQKIAENIKKKKIEEIEEAHNYLMENEVQPYKSKNEIDERWSDENELFEEYRKIATKERYNLQFDRYDWSVFERHGREDKLESIKENLFECYHEPLKWNQVISVGFKEEIYDILDSMILTNKIVIFVKEAIMNTISFASKDAKDDLYRYFDLSF